MPPPDVLRQNLAAAADFDRTTNAGTQGKLARLYSSMSTLPAELPAEIVPMLAGLREQRDRLSLAFLGPL